MILQFKETLISFINKQQWCNWKGDAFRICAMRNVDQTFV